MVVLRIRSPIKCKVAVSGRVSQGAGACRSWQSIFFVVRPIAVVITTRWCGNIVTSGEDQSFEVCPLATFNPQVDWRQDVHCWRRTSYCSE